MKAYEGLKLWSLIFNFNNFTHELIGPLYIYRYNTWAQTMSQEVLKFPIIDPKNVCPNS
jgi:hypothetical protein